MTVKAGDQEQILALGDFDNSEHYNQALKKELEKLVSQSKIIQGFSGHYAYLK